MYFLQIYVTWSNLIFFLTDKVENHLNCSFISLEKNVIENEQV